MSTIAYIRHTVNTLDEFYEKENDFNDENAFSASSRVFAALRRSAAASSASVAALTSILSYGISQNFISIPPLGLFDAYLIENDCVGGGCVFEHEFTAAAAKSMPI